MAEHIEQIKSESSSILRSFHQAFQQDQDMLQQYLTTLVQMISKKQPILQKNYFTQFYEMASDDIKYLKIVDLFKDMLLNDKIANNRKLYLLSHWLYYQIIQVHQDIQNEEQQLFEYLMRLLSSKMQIDKTITQIISKTKLTEEQSSIFRNNLFQSKQAYNILLAYLSSQNQMTVQAIKQKHTELLEIIKKMGKANNIIEYELQKLILVAFQAAYAKKSQEGQQAISAILKYDQLQKLIESNKRMNQKLYQKFNDLKSAQTKKDEYSILQGIKYQLTGIDVYLLKYLAELSEKNNKKSNSGTKKKDIVLLVGPSGSGKTTIILSVLGYKLQETLIQQLKTLQPVNLKKQHQALRTSPESVSITRYMFSTKIPKESFDISVQEENSNLQICDSPGFQDSNGPEVDIANSIGIQNFLKTCTSVKLVVVISQRTVGDRMEGIKSIAKIVSNIVKNYKSIQQSVEIVLNKFESEDQIKRLQYGVKNIQQNIPPAQSSNESYKRFLSSLGKKMRQKNFINFKPFQFDPQQFMQKMIQNKIFNPRQVFKYSLSTKSNQAKLNRKNLLIRLIRENLIKQNATALYYLRQLQIFSECLNDDQQINSQIQKIKDQIRTQVANKFKSYEQKINTQLLDNDANKNTFKDLTSISEEIKSYQIFQSIIQNIVTIKNVDDKNMEVKNQIIQDVKELTFQETNFLQCKQKVINALRFLSKFDSKKMTEVYQLLINKYETKKAQFDLFIKYQNLKQIRTVCSNLKNIFLVIEKACEVINTNSNNPQISAKNKKDEMGILQNQVLKVLKNIQFSITEKFKIDKYIQEIKEEQITFVKDKIDMLENLAEGGPIINDISANKFNKTIIQAINQYGKEIIERTNKIINSKQSQINNNQVENIKIYKANTLKLKLIQPVYGSIGPKIDNLWQNLQLFISNQTQRLKSILHDLKIEKKINKKNIKNFKSMIDKIIRFSEGDQSLVASTNRLKTQIKHYLIEHIEILKGKVDRMKFTIKLRKSLSAENIDTYVKYFQEIDAFYKVKQFNKPDYFATINDITKSMIKQSKEQDQDDEADMNIETTINQMYNLIIQKFLNPFKEMTQQSAKYKQSGMGQIPSNYLQTLEDFLSYKSILVQKELLLLNKDFQKKLQEVDKYADFISIMVDKIRKQFEQIAQNCNLLYQQKTQKLKQFKKFVNMIYIINKNPCLMEQFLTYNFNCEEYITKMLEIVKKAQEGMRNQLMSINQVTPDSMSKLVSLKKQAQQLRPIDYFDMQKTKFEQHDFKNIIEQIQKKIDKINGRHENAITNLFRGQAYITSDLTKMYKLISQDQLKNEDKIQLFETKVIEFADNLRQQISKYRGQYKRQDTKILQSINAYNLINYFQKGFKFYSDIQNLFYPKPIDYLSLSKAYFETEISELKLEQRLRDTYLYVKGKLQNFEYKTRVREFEKILTLIKKTENLIQYTVTNQHYNQIYKLIEKDEQQKVNKEQMQDLKKLSQRLKYFYDKTMNRFKKAFVENKQEQKSQFLDDPNFVKMYNNSSQEEKQIIDNRIQKTMQINFEGLQKAFEKPQQQRKKVEEVLQITIQKIPNNLRRNYKDQYSRLKQKMTIKLNNQIKVMRQKIDKSSATNLSGSISHLQFLRNPILEKQCISLIEQQIKASTKQIFGSNKKQNLLQSYKIYLKYYGIQNQLVIKKVKENQKLKILFSNQEKQILSQFIYQAKDIIRLIQISYSKHSSQDFISFQQRCNIMNQVYLIASEEQYSGYCHEQHQILLKLWVTQLQKMQKQFDEFQQTRAYLTCSSNSALKLDKIVIQLKLFRIFINSFLNICKKLIKKEIKQFVEIYKRYQAINIDKIILKNIENQYKQIAKQVMNKQFYNDQIRILNYVGLQKQFQNNLIDLMKILREYQNIYNYYVCEKSEENINFQQQIDVIQNKWLENIKMVQAELKQTIEYCIMDDVSPRIATIYSLSQIISNKRWDIVDKSLKSKERIENIFSNKFKQIQQKIYKQIESIERFISIKKLIQQEYEIRKSESKEKISQIKNRRQSQKAQLNKKICQTVDQQVKNNLALDLVNIQTLANQKIQQIKRNDYQNHLKQKKRHQQDLECFIRDNFIKSLIILKKISQTINFKSRQNSQKVLVVLKTLHDKDKSINKIIYKELNLTNNPYALIIASQSDIFKSQAAIQFKNRTAAQDIHYILDRCPQTKDNPHFKQDILGFYEMYNQEYNQIINQFKVNPDSQQIDIISNKLKDEKEKNETRRNSNVHPAITIARIFAIWSMMRTDISIKQNISVDFQPHPAQIVAISLLVGFSQNKLNNIMVEVLTGEGKSIVLAGVCCYLAIKGYFPYCACYSEYLSKRDEIQFKDLFEKIGVSNKIKYGTFNQHCEQIINQSSNIQIKKSQKKSFRQHLKSVIMGKADKQTSQYLSKIFDKKNHQRSKKILIIDEADIFFNQNFFGRLYLPSLSLDDEDTKGLIQWIWKKSKDSRQNNTLKLTQKDIYESQEFRKVLNRYPTIEKMLRNQVIGMIQAAYNYNHGYILHQDSIKYRQNDTITDKISYGYKTVFANCYEYERKAISQLSYSAALKISLNIAPFSYSELPNFFQSILGVSGTINSMSSYKKQTLKQKYGIEQTYQIPSIYGDSQRTKDQFKVVKVEQFYDKLVEHAKIVQETQRPIAIFFKTIKDVSNFYKSPQFKEFTKYTTILSEQTDSYTRQTIIKLVGQRSKITIMTESFSRGTDFKVLDPTIDALGGLHVIQTSISSDLSQYLQIRGRTARQGKKGSFQMLIPQLELEKFRINYDSQDDFQKLMKNAWILQDEAQQKHLIQKVQNASLKHKITQELFTKKFNKDQIIQFIFNNNKFTELKANHIRTLIGIDGTCSMGLALQTVLNIVQASCSRTKTVLDKKSVLGSFETQIGIYRNYDRDHEQIIQYSGFEADSQKLREFLEKISINGGWGNEAMQVLFQHANKLQKLDQIIMIADARSNSLTETKFKRANKGENYWVKNGFPLANQSQQIQKLKAKNVKIHTLYIYVQKMAKQKKQDLKKYCEQISNQTGGISSQFKLRDDSSAEFLTSFLVKNILMLIGGDQGEQLINSYNQEFGNIPLRL